MAVERQANTGAAALAAIIAAEKKLEKRILKALFGGAKTGVTGQERANVDASYLLTIRKTAQPLLARSQYPVLFQAEAEAKMSIVCAYRIALTVLT